MPGSEKKNRQLIYLVGMPGVGKSTIGNKLRKHFDIDFLDLDREIEKTAKHSVSRIFEIYGEKAFRDIEAKVLRSVSNQSAIIASGGGTPVYHNNMRFMLDNGVVIYLTLPLKMLITRINGSRTNRPLFQGKTKTELENFISELYEQRRPVYKKAPIHFSTKSVSNENLRELAKQIRGYMEKS